MAEEIVHLEFERPIVELEQKIAALKSAVPQEGKVDLSREIGDLEEKCRQLKNEIYGSLNPWQRVQLARHPRRPYTLDYIRNIFVDFIELHGDRGFAEDNSMICGMAMLEGRPVFVMGQQKGRNLHENLARNFGMAHPEGYRKAMRIMKMAEKFNRPVITFIDTPGAYPGIGAEERGQAEAIARNLRDMSNLRIPVIGLVIGEGGSGGALGIGVTNRVLMLENSYYSVITPEGCAAILFRDAARAPEAARALKVTAQDLYGMGIIDEIIPEPLGGAHRDVRLTCERISAALIRHIDELSQLTPVELAQTRYLKYRKMGVFTEEAPKTKPAAGTKKKTNNGG